MPRIVTVRLFGLWWAFTLNDSDEAGKPRFGFTQYQARARAAYFESKVR